MFKLVDTLRENIASPGRAFIAEPLHDFRWDDKHCYVILMQCDMTIDEYTENMSAKEKADELPRLFYQILEGNKEKYVSIIAKYPMLNQV
jgi:hypothetical protein